MKMPKMAAMPKMGGPKKPPVIKMATKPHLRTRKLSIAGKSSFSGQPAFAPPSTAQAPAPAFPDTGAMDAAPGDMGN